MVGENPTAQELFSIPGTVSEIAGLHWLLIVNCQYTHFHQNIQKYFHFRIVCRLILDWFMLFHSKFQPCITSLWKFNKGHLGRLHFPYCTMQFPDVFNSNLYLNFQHMFSVTRLKYFLGFSIKHLSAERLENFYILIC